MMVKPGFPVLMASLFQSDAMPMTSAAGHRKE